MLLGGKKRSIPLCLHCIVRDDRTIHHGRLAFFDKCLELRLLPLFLVQFAFKALVNALLVYIILFFFMVLNKLECVKQDVFLSLEELLVCCMVRVRFFFNLLDLTQVDLLL